MNDLKTEYTFSLSKVENMTQVSEIPTHAQVKMGQVVLKDTINLLYCSKKRWIELMEAISSSALSNRHALPDNNWTHNCTTS